MKSLFLAALMLGATLSAAAETADEAAVRAAHQAYINASKAGDAATLKGLFADQLQYSHSNAKMENKQEAIDALVKAKSNFEVHEQKIRVYGNAATIRARVTARNPAGDIPLSMLQVWVKNGGKWQLVERQTTRLPAQ